MNGFTSMNDREFQAIQKLKTELDRYVRDGFGWVDVATAHQALEKVLKELGDQGRLK
jgi:hypothetical protein